MLIDSHCHLASHRFPPEELPEILTRARVAGVARMVTLATSLDDIAPNLAISENADIHACIGIHPCDVHHAPDDAVEHIATQVSDPRVCAIGETGLDYYHPPPEGWDPSVFRKRQQDFLRQHFELAATAGLNVVIHTRDAWDETFEILDSEGVPARTIFHCFTGGPDAAERGLVRAGHTRRRRSNAASAQSS